MTKVVKVRELPGPAGSSKENDRTLSRKINQSSRTDDMDCFLSVRYALYSESNGFALRNQKSQGR